MKHFFFKFLLVMCNDFDYISRLTSSLLVEDLVSIKNRPSLNFSNEHFLYD